MNFRGATQHEEAGEKTGKRKREERGGFIWIVFHGVSKGLPQSPNQSRPTGNWARGERCLAVRECEKIRERKRETERNKGGESNDQFCSETEEVNLTGNPLLNSSQNFSAFVLFCACLFLQ